MIINTITTDDLRRMEVKDGLILQGCGGDLKEWVDGINDMLTEAGILKGGSKLRIFPLSSTMAQPVCSILLRVWSWTSGNLLCGVYRPMRILAVPGCLILYRTAWAVLLRNLHRSRKNRIAR